MAETLRPSSTTPSGTSNRPFVSIIVVNYNGGEKILRCLKSLQEAAYPARELIIVDNASSDGSDIILKDAASKHSELIVIWSKQNLGYAGGVNLAMEAARGDYIAVLNMDVVVESGWLEPMINFLEEHSEVGAVNPLLALADSERINAMGQYLHITGLGFNRGLGKSMRDVPSGPFRVSGIQGAAFVVRRSLLKRMGGMDTTGFLYHEDVNLSWLLNLMGFDLYCVPEAVVRHDYFLSMYPEKLHLLERNRWAMLLAYLHSSTLLILLPAFFATEILMWGYCFLRGWSFMKAKAASYQWVYQHRPQIDKRRRLATSLRVLSDFQLLRRFRWTYAWDQFVVLGRERGPSARQPEGGMPTAAG